MLTKMYIQTYNAVGENNQAANMYPPKNLENSRDQKQRKHLWLLLKQLKKLKIITDLSWNSSSKLLRSPGANIVHTSIRFINDCMTHNIQQIDNAQYLEAKS
jgi:hypothetical protein